MDINNDLKILTKKEVLAWAFYDWANSAFATIVLAGFFPIFFKNYWDSYSDTALSTLHLGIANAIPALIMLFLSPLIGAFSDIGGFRKKSLLFFTLVGCISTFSLFFISKGSWVIASLFYIIGSIGFMGTGIFYDALILIVSPEKKLDIVSAFGFALGYLGGAILLVFCILITFFPEFFFLKDKAQGVRISFPIVAVWWLLFSIPAFLFIHEKKEELIDIKSHVTQSIKRIFHTISNFRKNRVIFFFLFSYWLYIDGVDTVARMAIDYGLSIGFGADKLVLCLLITQLVGIPAAFFFGYLGQIIGSKTGIYISIAGYFFITIWGSMIKNPWEFYALAFFIGIFQGGIQALSRSFFAKIIPKNRNAEFFGFYDMMGKFATLIGPLLIGFVTSWTHNHRIGLLSIIILFFAGGLMLFFVDEKGKAHIE